MYNIDSLVKVSSGQLLVEKCKRIAIVKYRIHSRNYKTRNFHLNLHLLCIN